MMRATGVGTLVLRRRRFPVEEAGSVGVGATCQTGLCCLIEVDGVQLEVGIRTRRCSWELDPCEMHVSLRDP